MRIDVCTFKNTLVECFVYYHWHVYILKSNKHYNCLQRAIAGIVMQLNEIE